MTFKLLFVAALAASASAAALMEAKATDYCALNSQHMLCLYPTPVYGDACNGRAERVPMTDDIIKTLVDSHNEYRNKVAGGGETLGKPGPQKKAANMKQLTWSAELARMAQAHTDQCIYEHTGFAIRKTAEYWYLGENLAMWWPSSNAFKKGVDMWYGEVKDRDKNAIVYAGFTTPATGHYTQVVWAETDVVGCSFTKIGGGSAMLHSCLYGVGGNMMGASIYTEGEPASQCKAGYAKSSKYPNLCAKQ